MSGVSVQYFIRTLLIIIAQKFYFQGGKNKFHFLLKYLFLFPAKNGYQQKLKSTIHNRVKTRRQGFLMDSSTFRVSSPRNLTKVFLEISSRFVFFSNLIRS